MLLFIPALFGASIVIFVIMRIMPGDVALVVLGADEPGAVINPRELERVRTVLGLNQPLALQYVEWLGGVITLNPGNSLALRRGYPLTDLVRQRFPVTLQLGLYTIVLSLVVSIPLGVISALRHDRFADYVVRSASIVGLAMPNFWVASLFILFVAIYFGWTPPIFYANVWQSPFEHFQKMLPAAVVLSWGYSSLLIRMTRSTVLEVLRQDYMRTAAAKGLPRMLQIRRHALRNILIPVVTVAGLQVAGVASGSVVMETVFGLPGIGSLGVDAVRARDYPVVQFVIALFVFVSMAVNLLVDLMYGWLDPRIRYGR